MLGRFYGVDEFDTNGLASTVLDYVLDASTFGGVKVPAKYHFNANNVGGQANPDLKRLSGTTYVAYDTNINGDVVGTNTVSDQRGWRYNAGPVTKVLLKVRAQYYQPLLIKRVAINGSASDRSDFFYMSPYRNMTSLTITVTGGGSPTNFKGVKGYARSLKTFIGIPIFTVPFSQWNTIEQRFPASLEEILLRANGVAGVINDRLSECINLKRAIFIDYTGGAFAAAPYTFYTGSPQGSMALTGVVSFSHCPLLEEIGIHSTTITSIAFHAATVFKFFQISSTTTITATELRTAINLALSSTAIVKLLAFNNGLTWSRSIGNADISSTLTWLYLYNNSITGDITITTAKPNLKEIKTGLQTFRTGLQQNSHPTVDLSGATGATLIDLTGSNVDNLTLPVNTVCTELALFDNKLSLTTNPNLITQINAMTAMTVLRLGNSSIDVGQAIGQSSSDGIGANPNFSGLVNMTHLWLSACKATGTLTLANVNKLIALVLTANTGLTTLVNFTAHTSLQLLFAQGCTNLSYAVTNAFTALTNVFVGESAVTSVDFSGKTSSSFNEFWAYSCPNLTTVTFRAGGQVFGSPRTIKLNNNPLLTTLNNLSAVSWNAKTFAQNSFDAYSCALDMTFPFGANDFCPSDARVDNNAMSQANVDATIDSYYTNRRKWDTYTIAVTLNIGGTNAAPSGTYQAPTGYKSQSITGITKASTAVATVSAIGSLANNDVIRIRSVVGMTQVNNQYFMIKNISGNTFELWDEAGTNPINSTAYSTYGSGGFAQVDGTPASQKEKAYVLVNNYGRTITMN